MILAVDIGNTNIVLGLYEDYRLVQHWRIDSNVNRTVDDYGHLVLYMLERTVGADRVRGMVIGSVVPLLTYVFGKMANRYFGCRARRLDGTSDLGIEYRVDTPPHNIGADRLANALAVFQRYRQNCIVVDVGTATTFDVVSREGAYLGGVIAPGIRTCAEALVRKAAMLSRVEIMAPERVIGRETRSMMQSGIFFGAICQIDGLVERMRREWPVCERVIATGGFVHMIEKFSRQVDTFDPDLTLDGLRLAYDRLPEGPEREPERLESTPEDFPPVG